MTQDTELPATEPQEEVNPLLIKLRKRLPGETFRLPSRGMFYTNGEVDPEVEDGEIVIFPMNGLDELKMRTPDMLLQGSAITEVIASCVPQIKQPSQLLAADVDYILTCLRKVSYGALLPIKHKCRFCEAPAKEYNLSLDHFINASKEISREQFEKMTITLGEAFTVKLKPCTFEEFTRILQRANTDFSDVEKLSEWINSGLVAVIKSVDGIKDKNLITGWVEKLSPMLKEDLSAQIEICNQWGVEFAFDIQCDKCEKQDNLKSTLNPTGFFMLPSSQKTRSE